MAFGIDKKLLSIRKDLGLTQQQMSEKLDISFRHYQNLEHGLDPSIPMLEKIIQRLGITSESFFGAAMPKLTPRDLVSLIEPILQLSGSTQRRKSLILALISSDLSYLESLDKSQSLHAQALLKAL